MADNLIFLQYENQKLKEKIDNLEIKLINQEKQYNEIVRDLQNKNQYLELKYDDILKENLDKSSSKEILEFFERNFSEIFEKFSNLKENFLGQTPTKYSDENLVKFRFLKFLFAKFEDDNLWLIGKLKELSEENQELNRQFNRNPIERLEFRQNFPLDVIFVLGF